MAAAESTSNHPGRARLLRVCGLGVALAVLDQLAKLAVTAWLHPGESVQVIPGFFNLVLTHNRGAAFGILNRPDIEWQRWLFIGATLAAVALIGHMAWHSRDKGPLLPTALGLVLGGALGNLVDRVQTGRVIDFLDFHLAGRHWPAFNVADIGITVGATLLLISLYAQGRRPGARRKSEDA